MRVVVWSDLHADANAQLGVPLDSHGNTRLQDAERALQAIAQRAAAADVVVFAGDLALTARPGPLVYRMAIEALKQCRDVPFYALMGNHDWLPEDDGTPVHVLARALDGVAVDRPRIVALEGLQIGFLPWTPPVRMFERAPNDPTELAQLVGDTVTDVAQGLAEQLDPAIPSLLIGHWFCEGPYYEFPWLDPVLQATRLEAQGWDVVLMGHNHLPKQISDRAWIIGPPMRETFNEAENPTGFLELEWGEPGTLGDEGVGVLSRPSGGNVVVRYVPVPDRDLLTWEIADVDTFLRDREKTSGWPKEWGATAPLNGAVVRVRYTCSAEAAAAMVATGAFDKLAELILACGALKVIGPLATVIREERVVRSDIDVDDDPTSALRTWLEREGVQEDLHDDVIAEAQRIMAGDPITTAALV